MSDTKYARMTNAAMIAWYAKEMSKLQHWSTADLPPYQEAKRAATVSYLSSKVEELRDELSLRYSAVFIDELFETREVRS